MADASKLKGLKRTGLGVPPASDEARTDLNPTTREEQTATQVDSSLLVTYQTSPQPRLDGRSMRRSGRTVQFATRVSPDFDERIRHIAMRDGLLLVEVLERALKTYEQKS